MAVAAALAIGLVVIARRQVPPVTATTSATSAVVMTAADPAPPTPASHAKDETPTMSVDALPQASTKAATGPVVKGYGRLGITASPGWCHVAVDGKDKGPTPIAALDLTAGNHTITCKPPSGKTKSMTVFVPEGQVTKQKFSFED